MARLWKVSDVLRPRHAWRKLPENWAHLVSVSVQEGQGSCDNQTLVVRVKALDSPPRLVSQLPTEAPVNVLYLYDAEVLDSDGDALSFWSVAAPPDMIMDTETGLIQWTPSI
jgi:hypothetical protein